MIEARTGEAYVGPDYQEYSSFGAFKEGAERTASIGKSLAGAAVQAAGEHFEVPELQQFGSEMMESSEEEEPPPVLEEEDQVALDYMFDDDNVEFFLPLILGAASMGMNMFAKHKASQDKKKAESRAWRQTEREAAEEADLDDLANEILAGGMAEDSCPCDGACGCAGCGSLKYDGITPKTLVY
jgi:hypothetical protein